MIANIGRSLLALIGLTAVASTALAQGNTFNPYGNSGYADYREFGNPMVSNNPALPGQSILNSQPLVSRPPRANSFQDYTDELDGVDPGIAAGRRGSSTNVPYYQAYQRLNSDFNRVYRPNNTEADRKFYERQRQREENYAKAIKETDPLKRAKLLRQVELDTLDHPAAASRAAGARGAATTKAAATGSATATRSTPPANRRQPAPPPSTVGRTGTSRAPAPPTSRSATAPPPPGSRPSTTTTRTRPAPDPSTIPIPPPR